MKSSITTEILINEAVLLTEDSIGKQVYYDPSFVQERLWFINKISGESKHYNIPIAFKITGQLDVAALKNVIVDLVRRHEMLRAQFNEVDGKLKQFICDHLDIGDIFTVKNIEDARTPEMVKIVIQRELEDISFDLTHAPLFKVKLLYLNDNHYLLVLCFHHIIADEHAIEVFLTELSELYNSYANQKKPTLDKLKARYVVYAAWQKRNFARSATLKKYWKENINIEEPVLNFPFDYKRKPIPTYHGDKVTIFQEFDIKCLRNLASTVHGSTTFMALLATYFVFLYRYTGQELITVGIPFTNRSHPALQNIFGMFINSLPIQLRINGNMSLAEVVRQVKTKILDAYRYGELPFEKIVDVLSLERNPAHNLLFQTMFFNTNLAQPMNLGGCEITSENVESKTSKFDFSVSYSLRNGGINYEVEYSTDLLKAQSVSRFTRHLINITLDAIQNPDKAISQLNILTEEEYQWSIYGVNDNARSFREEIRVIEIFEEMVKKHPDTIAVEYRNNTITYRELNKRANQVAHDLRAKGVGPEKCVVVFMERSIDVVIALLGVMKAGGVFIPLDIEYPQARIEHILLDSQASVILTQKKYLPKLVFAKAEKLVVECEDFDYFEQFESDDVKQTTSMNNLVYIIYTSGSTGNPKGVMIKQLGLAHYIMWAIEYYDCHKGCGCPVHSSLGFDLTITMIFAPLCSGKTIFMTPEELGVEGLLNALTARQDYSIIKITPAHLKLFQELLLENILKKLFATVVIGGEALYADDLAFWRKNAPNLRFINEYGATETSVADTIYELGKELPETTSIPVGKAIPNSSMFVLDQHLSPQPIGVIGEIYLGGNQIARGYLNLPDLNSTRFLSTPFKKLIGDHIYKTGDLGQLLADGNVVFVGRVDNQVKINGYRIELGEIETRLEEVNEINQAICKVCHSNKYGKHIVTYIVPQDRREQLDTKAINNYLKTKLPEYMLPKFYVPIKKLPLTINGKVDVKALPNPEIIQNNNNDIIVAPRNKIEAILCKVWTELFNLDEIGVNSNFFQLGGDSITSLQMIFEAKKFGLNIKPKHVFYYQTIAELATVAEFVSLETNMLCPKGELPLVPIQQWFFHQNLSNYNHWNQAFVLNYKTLINIDHLRLALLKLAKHHDALRLRFIRNENGWVQSYTDELLIDNVVTEVELAAVSTEQVNCVIQKAHTCLDIEVGKLFHAVLLQGNKASKIILVVHHLVTDGVSWRILVEDIEKLLLGANSELLPKTSALGQWALKFQDYVKNISDKTIEYWQRVVLRQSTLKLLIKNSMNYEGSASAAIGQINKLNTTNFLTQLSINHINLQEILLVAIAALLKAYTSDHEIIIDIEGHGREDLFNDINLTRTVGWFTSTYPILISLDFENISDALVYMRSTLVNIPDKGVSYGALRYLHPNKEIRNSLEIYPQVCLNYLGNFDAKANFNHQLELTFENAGQNFADMNIRPYQLNINCYLINGELCYQLIGNFDHKKITKLVNDFAGIINDLTNKLVCKTNIKNMLKLAEGVKPIDVPRIMQNYDSYVTSAYPLTSMQEGMLYHSLYSPESNEYICQMCWRLEGDINLDKINLTWQKLTKYHDALRTVFCWENTSDIYQVILDKTDITISYHKFDDVNGLEQFLIDDFKNPFNLSDHPPLRVAVITCQNEYYMLWTFHHIILDGWSVARIINDFTTVYSGRDIKISTFKFKQYVDWLIAQPHKKGLTYWQDYLNKCNWNPITCTIKKNQPAVYKTHELQINQDVLEKLLSFSKQHSVTLNAICLSALGVGLQKIHGLQDFLLGLTISGRNVPLSNIENGVGNFLNTIPTAVKLTHTNNFIELIKMTQADLIDHQEYEHISLADIQRERKLITETDSLFDMLYVFENYPVVKIEDTNIGLQDLVVREYANYPLTFVVGIASPSSTGLAVKLAYDTTQVDQQMVVSYLTAFEQVLNSIIDGNFNFESSVGIPRQSSLPNYSEHLADVHNKEVKIKLDNTVVQKLLLICGKILQGVKAHLEDNFTNIGGTSLSTIRMVSHIRQTFGIEISLKEFNACANLGQLTKVIQHKLANLGNSADEFEDILI